MKMFRRPIAMAMLLMLVLIISSCAAAGTDGQEDEGVGEMGETVAEGNADAVSADGIDYSVENARVQQLEGEEESYRVSFTLNVQGGADYSSGENLRVSTDPDFQNTLPVRTSIGNDETQSDEPYAIDVFVDAGSIPQELYVAAPTVYLANTKDVVINDISGLDMKIAWGGAVYSLVFSEGTFPVLPDSIDIIINNTTYSSDSYSEESDENGQSSYRYSFPDLPFEQLPDDTVIILHGGTRQAEQAVLTIDFSEN